MIRILLSDDHAIVRRGLSAVLSAEPDLEVVAEADRPEEAVLHARSQPVDVVLLDLQYSTSSRRGTEVIPELRALDPAPTVLVLTTYDNDEDVLTAMDAGADGYLLKDSSPEDLAAAVRRAAGGRSALDRRVADRLARRDAEVALSAREREVLVLVAAGRTNAAIAAELFLSQATVKTHLVHIFDKLQARSRTDAVAKARAAGILRPES